MPGVLLVFITSITRMGGLYVPSGFAIQSRKEFRMTTTQDIRNWFNLGVRGGASHLLVVVDEFDYTDFPIYAADKAYLEALLQEYATKPMYRVMEVYRLDQDREEQLNEYRCWSI